MKWLAIAIAVFMASSIQRTDSGAIKVTPDGKVQLALDLPDPTLFCDSISASNSKCGFSEFDDGGDPSDPPKLYLHSQTVEAGSFGLTSSSTGCIHVEDTGSSAYNYSVASNLESEYARETCAASVTENTASSDAHVEGTSGTNPPVVTVDCHHSSDTDCWVGLNTTCDSCDPPPSPSYISSTTTTKTEIVFSESCANSFMGEPDVLGCVFACSKSGLRTISQLLTNEYTTDLLISNTEDDLPDYSNCWACDDGGCGSCGDDCSFEEGQGCVCSASYDLSDDETSLALQNFQYLFTMDATPPAAAVLHWVERFIPDLTEDIIFEGNPYSAGDPDPDPSHWVDNQKSFTWDGSQTQTGIFECEHPHSNGEITIEDVRWN
jgi:hypothetical protein